MEMKYLPLFKEVLLRDRANDYGATALCILPGKLCVMTSVSEKIVQSQLLEFGGCTCSYQWDLAGYTSLFSRYKRGI
jgi:hypothetical protein